LDKKEFNDLMNKRHDEGELKAAFDAFDADGSGFITKKELKEAMCTCGGKKADKEIDDMIKAADTSGDGKVSFEGEFSISLQDLGYDLKIPSCRVRKSCSPAIFP
jgi:Ca2+-binding EF-hand superfamily protein